MEWRDICWGMKPHSLDVYEQKENDDERIAIVASLF